MRALDAALGTPWAILPTALEQILDVAARQNEVTPEALEAYRAQSVSRAERMSRRGTTAILDIDGPLFHKANLFTELSGATSYELLRRDLQVALDDRDIKSILLNIDSPGGDAAGAGELAKAIYAAEKPVAAYVSGTGASAAYWIASAADQIVLDDSASVGSIGVVVGLSDARARDDANGIRRWEFVSSQSPKKRAKPDTEAGAAEYQRLADEMAEVFVGAVANHRGTDAETVANDFGRGGIMIGARAVAAGMADRVGTFEETVNLLSSGEALPRAPGMRDRRQAARDEPTASATAETAQSKGPDMSEDNQADNQAAANQTDIAAERSAAVKADRERRTAIMALDEAKGREDLAEHLHATTEHDVQAVQAILAKAPKAEGPAPADGKGEDTTEAYDRSRVTGAGMGGEAKPQGRAKASINPREIYDNRRAQAKG